MLTPYDPWLSWLLPIVGAAVLLLIRNARKDIQTSVVLAFVGAAALFSFSLIPDVLTGRSVDVNIPGTFSFVGVLVDPLSVLTASTINGVGFLILLFSSTYMGEDPNINRFYFIAMVFIGGLSLIAMADNLLLVVIGWEATGLCTAFLANFWYSQKDKARAGLKTFLTLRVGDAFLLVAVLAIFVSSSTFNYIELGSSSGWAARLSASGLLLPVSVMLFIGCMMKSAQFPLHEWLPEALQASPSSFNAIVECIAGVYFVARIIPLFHPLYVTGFVELETLFLIIAFVGGISAFAVACLALVEPNVERCLSYSITSQYGFIILGLGVSGLSSHIGEVYLASVMYLVVDAVASAILFLAVAAVIFRINTENLFEMKVPKALMTVTYACLFIGVLELFGMPPLTGFWVEEGVSTGLLELIHSASMANNATLTFSAYALYSIFFISAVITCIYGVRLLGLIFNHKSTEKDWQRPVREMKREAPLSMLIPLVILAGILPLWGLLMPVTISNFYNILAPVIGHPTISRSPLEILFSAFVSQGFILSVLAYTGIFVGYKIYIEESIKPPVLIERYAVFGLLNRVLSKGFYVNALYNRIGSTFISLSMFLHRTVEARGAELTRARRMMTFFEDTTVTVLHMARRFHDVVEVRFDAFNYLVADKVAIVSRESRKMQSVLFSNNMLLVLLGLALIVVVMLMFG